MANCQNCDCDPTSQKQSQKELFQHPFSDQLLFDADSVKDSLEGYKRQLEDLILMSINYKEATQKVINPLSLKWDNQILDTKLKISWLEELLQ